MNHDVERQTHEPEHAFPVGASADGSVLIYHCLQQTTVSSSNSNRNSISIVVEVHRHDAAKSCLVALASIAGAVLERIHKLHVQR